MRFNLLKKIAPPFLFDFLKKLTTKYGWFGDYASWEEASAEATGYDSTVIVEKVKEALLKVKKGEACYERDSVLFYAPMYIWPILTFLMKSASESNNKLFVTDFGGSLGSLYFQHRTFFQSMEQVLWNVVEQPLFVENGKKYFEDDCLKFYHSLHDIEGKMMSGVAVFSSVLQYLPNPYQVLEEALAMQYPYIIIDRTPYLKNKSKDLLTIQKVSPSVYPASYPAWFFSEDKMKEFIHNKNYKIVAEFPNTDTSNTSAVFKGIVLSPSS